MESPVYKTTFLFSANWNNLEGKRKHYHNRSFTRGGKKRVVNQNIEHNSERKSFAKNGLYTNFESKKFVKGIWIMDYSKDHEVSTS